MEKDGVLSWETARLIPVSGMRNAEEQERRALLRTNPLVPGRHRSRRKRLPQCGRVPSDPCVCRVKPGTGAEQKDRSYRERRGRLAAFYSFLSRCYSGKRSFCVELFGGHR